jgi:hypothetical protein
VGDAESGPFLFFTSFLLSDSQEAKIFSGWLDDVQLQRYSVDGFAWTFLRSRLGCRWGPPFVLGVPSEWLQRFNAGVLWIGCLIVCFKGFWSLWQRLLGVIYFLLMGSSCVKTIFGFL